jgi:hypothetical protein
MAPMFPSLGSQEMGIIAKIMPRVPGQLCQVALGNFLSALRDRHPLFTDRDCGTYNDRVPSCRDQMEHTS